MTTREKEIEQAMKESVAGTIYASGWGMTPQATDLLECAFTKGAEWADRTMLDKVCEWLKENVEYAVMKKNGKHTIELAGIGLWEDMCRKRSIDYLKTHIYPRESLFYDNGDCKFGADTNILCKIDSDIAFAKLKRKRSREIISLYCQGARPIDIADELGVTLSSVSSYLCRDLKMLRTALA